MSNSDHKSSWLPYYNTVPFREKVSWFKLRIIPLFTSNRWCASHKTFSFLTSSFLGFGSIRWIWHITHKIQEDSISKKASSWKVKLFDKSPFEVRSTSSLVSDENGVFGELFFLFDIMPLPSRIYTEIPGVFRYGEFLIIVWFWYDMKFCPKILVWEVILHLCIYLSLLSLFFCYNNCNQVHRFFFIILFTKLRHLTERKILIKFMNFPLKLSSKNCQENISRTLHQKNSVNSNR